MLYAVAIFDHCLHFPLYEIYIHVHVIIKRSKSKLELYAYNSSLQFVKVTLSGSTISSIIEAITTA